MHLLHFLFNIFKQNATFTSDTFFNLLSAINFQYALIQDLLARPVQEKIITKCTHWLQKWKNPDNQSWHQAIKAQHGLDNVVNVVQ